ncbi:MAG: ATP-binding cassette domain-containing protein [Rhizobiales bacterium]|nr:ATP-binding cassette domain-containing protein [Hyphomicrobiales bacterium]
MLRGVDFRVSRGEVVGVLGPNGAGKSTLFAALLGLIPATGRIEFLGRTDLTGRDLGRTVAFIPQDRDVAWPMSVEKVVGLGRLPYRTGFGRPGPQDTCAIERAMAAVEVQNLRRRPISELSGGERSRALIARALAQEAPLILADEPTSGLDPAHQIALLDLLRRRATTGQTILLTIHELHLAARWCDRLLLLHEQRVVADGRPAEVLTRERVAAVYGCDVHLGQSADGALLVIPQRLIKGEPAIASERQSA